MNILNEIVKRTRQRIEEQKKIISPEKCMETAFSYNIDSNFLFEKALRSKDIAFICEIKKASPSKGIIAENFDYISIAKDYEKAGAAAISVLTEPYYFLGNNRYLTEISEEVSIPLLRKDFIIDPYMIYEAKVLGASAVLLICSILDEKSLAEYIKIADSLGLSTLVETHDKNEVKTALNASARIVGVNNRNLKTFEIDMSLTKHLKKMVNDDIIFVSESGIRTPEDIEKLREIGGDAALIGESIMRADDKKAEITRLRGII